MKIKNEDLVILRNAIAPLDTPERRELYRAGKFSKSELCKDKDMRYRWDLLYASRLKIGDGIGIQGDVNLYAYLNDSHIDTALRSLVANLDVDAHYVIYSPNESAASDDGAGFWNNEDGWTLLEGATEFSGSGKDSFNLPIATGQDARWVLRSEAQAHYANEAVAQTNSETNSPRG